MEVSVWFVCLLGMGIVFLGLVAIVILCTVVSRLCRTLTGDGEKKDASAPVAAPAPAAAPAAAFAAPIADRSKKLAAVCAVLAEELGTDVSAIRVKSFKKI